MKTKEICIAVALVLFLGLSLFSYLGIKSDADEMLGLVDGAISAIDAGDHASAKARIDEAQARWQEIRHGWELTCDHGELDVITGSFARAAAMAKSDQSLDELGAELAALAAMIEEMPVRTAPRIENII